MQGISPFPNPTLLEDGISPLTPQEEAHHFVKLKLSSVPWITCDSVAIWRHRLAQTWPKEQVRGHILALGMNSELVTSQGKPEEIAS